MKRANFSPSFVRQLMLPRSLTRSLFSRMALVMLAGALVVGSIAQIAVSGTVNKNSDQQLILGANLLVNLMHDELQDIQRQRNDPHFEVAEAPLMTWDERHAFKDYIDRRMFRVWYNGQLRMGSASGPANLPEPVVSHSINQVPYFTNYGTGHDAWRIYTLSAVGGDPVVEVGERLETRNDLVARIVLEVSMPLVFTALLLLLIIWYSLRTGLKDLEKFSLFIARQRGSPPFEALYPPDWSMELSQLIEVINGLFKRIEQGIGRERKFIDMAAHQLRTPLSGLSLEAQLCAKIKDPDELSSRLTRLNQSTRRVSNLLDQLLNLAQIEAIGNESSQRLSCKEVLGDIAADLAPVAARRGVEIAMEGDDLVLPGQGMALHLLLSNVLENAVKHAPDGSEVLIQLSSSQQGFDHVRGQIEISDLGPGMSDDEKEHAFDRFWQAEKGKTSVVQGSGLGLAIAQEAAQVLKGHLSLHDRADGRSGLMVRFISE